MTTIMLLLLFGICCRFRVESIEPSFGARHQVSRVQEERVGDVHDSRHWQRWSDYGVASERVDVRDLSISL